MSIGKIIRALNYKQLLSLVGWFLKHPLFMICTIHATLVTFKISQREFPNIHGLHNKANAFRHSMWNALIANKCRNVSSNIDSILNWTEGITDWHEDFSPNPELIRAMDLHNNKIGRTVFRVNQEKNNDALQSVLMSKLTTSILVTSISEVSRIKDELIYLEE